ncbi:hypothetical protein QR680_005363 [Steinernema hermaphroditum]|uniref:Uncharacterized protein n=1 Tax=Steinernema hermaphroditum TaxID=289476 RepID=A0AA39LV82_9BILA|nr:hypothetical protein QR680_005363 [Steinernema hermaphroditum]
MSKKRIDEIVALTSAMNGKNLASMRWAILPFLHDLQNVEDSAFVSMIDSKRNLEQDREVVSGAASFVKELLSLSVTVKGAKRLLELFVRSVSAAMENPKTEKCGCRENGAPGRKMDEPKTRKKTLESQMVRKRPIEETPQPAVKKRRSFIEPPKDDRKWATNSKTPVPQRKLRSILNNTDLNLGESPADTTTYTVCTRKKSKNQGGIQKAVDSDDNSWLKPVLRVHTPACSQPKSGIRGLIRSVLPKTPEDKDEKTSNRSTETHSRPRRRSAAPCQKMEAMKATSKPQKRRSFVNSPVQRRISRLL